jgi:thioredoxin-related protein
MKIKIWLFISVLIMLSSEASYGEIHKLTSLHNTHNVVATALPKYSLVYDDTSDPFVDAVAAVKLAKETDRNVLIEIGGNWCSWCHKMDAFLESNPEGYKTLHSKYVLLKISVSDSNENEAFMKSLPPVLGYPHMYISTSAGKMLLSKDTAELIEEDDYSKKQWLLFLNKWQVSNTIKIKDSVKAADVEGNHDSSS